MLLGLTPPGTKCRASYHTCVTRLGTIIAVLILGFGIGANRATFSLIDTVLLRPLPNYVEPEKMMAIYMPSESAANEGFDYPDYLDYATVQHTFTALSLSAWDSFDLVENGSAERIKGHMRRPACLRCSTSPLS